MAFDEEHYLPALKEFLTYIELNDPTEIRIKVDRNGYRMLLARFGYAPKDGVMIKRTGDLEVTRIARLAATNFDSMSGSAFAADARIRMADGNHKLVSELEVGEEVAIGGLVTAICELRQRNITDLGSMHCGSGSGVFHEGRWLCARDHPEAIAIDLYDGLECYMIVTLNHRMMVNDELFSDFYETVTRQKELLDRSDEALAIMNTMKEKEKKAGCTTRLWRRQEIDIIWLWWGAMLEAGYGDWGDGPSVDEVSRFGVLAELNGAPVACVFFYFQSSTRYGAVYGAICDISKSSRECRQGIALAVHAAVEYYRSISIEEIVC